MHNTHPVLDNARAPQSAPKPTGVVRMKRKVTSPSQRRTVITTAKELKTMTAIIANLIIELDKAYAELAELKGEPVPTSIGKTIMAMTGNS
jgi:hypothetical protein